MSFKKILSATKQGGYTLLELAISVAIFGIMTAIVVFNYGDFSSNIVMTNLAYETALSVRQAQVYGVSVKGQDITDPNAFNRVYGVHVNYPDHPREVVTFIDRGDSGGSGAGNNRYDGDYSCDTTDTECLEKIRYDNRVFIKDICVSDGTVSATEDCASSGAFDSANIVFRRPDPDAVITVDNDPTQYGLVRVELQSATGMRRDVVVRVTGQISVVNPTVTP